MLADIPCQCAIIKYIIINVSVSQVLKGLQSLYLTFWLLSDICSADRDLYKMVVLKKDCNTEKEHDIENISKWYNHIHTLRSSPYDDLS